MLEEQVKAGDMAARNRRRRDHPSATPMEVNNKDTHRMITQLRSIQSQIKLLNDAIKDLTETNQIIGQKSDIVDKILKENANEKQVRRASDRDAKLSLIK